jgi:predicted O-methyltransferase YrrM
MSRGSIGLAPALQDWVLEHGVRDDSLLAELRRETAALPNGGMQVSPEQGQLLTLLARMLGARRIIEVGVFTGYSSLCLARGLAEEGLLLACDVSPEYTAVARAFWRKAGVESRIELVLAPAADTLAGRLRQGWGGTVDLVFIDADKGNYPVYYEQALELLRPGGLVLVDNMLWSGKVADPTCDDPDTRAIRELARLMHDDPRIDPALLPVGDGLAMGRKV